MRGGRGLGGGGGGGRWKKREIIYLWVQNDSFIRMGGDESHFNVLLIVRDKVTRQCPQTTTFLLLHHLLLLFIKRRESRSGIEQNHFCLPA